MASDEKLMRGGYANAQGLRELTRLLKRDSVGVEIGSYKGESAQIFMDSGQVRKLVCVDSWPYGEWAEAEKHFDRNTARFGKWVIKIKGESVNVAPRYKNQTFDFAYIDANHEYSHVKADNAAWRLKVKAGGIICGHDFHPKKFPGVCRAVMEDFGSPTYVFQDHSWAVVLPANTFQIVTYVSGGYAECLKLTLPTWLDNAKAERIVIYTDSEEMASQFPANDKVEWRHHFKEKSDKMTECWKRKIAILNDAFLRCPTKFFCWLDADIYCASSFKDAFFRIGTNAIGATRMFNTTERGRGELNAGVIFFRHDNSLYTFFEDWAALSDEFEKIGKGGIWFEQASASKLIHEAFHGLRRYNATALSDNLYNLEDDLSKKWIERIQRHKPKLIHLKQGRWRHPDLVRQIQELAPVIKEHWESRARLDEI